MFSQHISKKMTSSRSSQKGAASRIKTHVVYICLFIPPAPKGYLQEALPARCHHPKDCCKQLESVYERGFKYVRNFLAYSEELVLVSCVYLAIHPIGKYLPVLTFRLFRPHISLIRRICGFFVFSLRRLFFFILGIHSPKDFCVHSSAAIFLLLDIHSQKGFHLHYLVNLDQHAFGSYSQITLGLHKLVDLPQHHSVYSLSEYLLLFRSPLT